MKSRPLRLSPWRILVPIVFLTMMTAVPALAGRNANGALIVHTDDSVAYTVTGDYCLTNYLPASCEAAITRTDKDENTPAVIWLLAAFPDTSSPAVTAIQFGIDHNLPANEGYFERYAMCASLEMPDQGWPETGFGNLLSFGSVAKTDRLFPFYWFAAYGFEGAYFGTRTYPSTDEAKFVDDSLLPQEDIATKFGEVRWNTEGTNECPGPDGSDQPEISNSEYLASCLGSPCTSGLSPQPPFYRGVFAFDGLAWDPTGHCSSEDWGGVTEFLTKWSYTGTWLTLITKQTDPSWILLNDIAPNITFTTNLMIFTTHGYFSHPLVEYYTDLPHAEAALTAYIQSGRLTAQDAMTGYDSSLQCGYIYVQDTGVQNLLSDNGDQTLLFAGWCDSSIDSYNWHYLSFYGYPPDHWVLDMCSDMKLLFERLACEWGRLAGTDFGYASAGLTGCSKGECRWVQSAEGSCEDVAAAFYQTGANADSVWGKTEVRFSRISAYGRERDRKGRLHPIRLGDAGPIDPQCKEFRLAAPSMGSETLVLRAEAPNGEVYESENIARASSAHVPTRLCVSEGRRWKSSGAALVELIRSPTDRAVWVPVSTDIEGLANRREPPPNPCDIVLYASQASLATAEADELYAREYDARVFVGDGSIEQAHAAVSTALEDNMAYREWCFEYPELCEREYPAQPTLGLVGDPYAGAIEVATWDCPISDPCPFLGAAGDLNQDGLEDVPVYLLPATDTDDIAAAALHAEHYETATGGNPRAVFLVDDSEGGNEALRVLGPLQEACTYRNIPSCRLYASHYASVAERKAAFAAAVNEGASLISGFGWITDAHRWPAQFLDDYTLWSETYTKTQGAVVILPQCNTANELWRQDSAVREGLFVEGGTGIAFAAGGMDAGWDLHQRLAIEGIGRAYAEAPHTDDWARVIWEAKKALIQARPYMRDPLKTIGCIGTAVRARAMPAAIADGERREVARLRVLGDQGRGQMLEFAVPYGKMGTLLLYDVGGRVVLELWRGVGDGRVQKVIVGPSATRESSLPSGIYFARLAVRSGERLTTKIIVVK